MDTLMTTRRIVLSLVFTLLVAPLALVPAGPVSGAPVRAVAAVQSEIEDDDGRLNILLLGGDAGWDRAGLRTDTMIVVSVELATARVAMFGVPRNLASVPLPKGAAELFPCRCWPDLLNALYGYGMANPQLFPSGRNPGATALMDTIGGLLGIWIDHYALVDLLGFVQVVDALGGLTLDVPTRVVIQPSPPEAGGEWRTYDIQPGRQRLDGHAALAYVRSREDGSDYDRMGRQRCVLGVLAREADVPGLARSYPKLVDALRASVATDVPVDLLPDLIKLAAEVDASQVVAIGFVPPSFQVAGGAPNVELIRQTVQAAFGAPNAPGDGSLATLPASCGWAA
jgi:LCP family protein required for cell wall assembly